MGGWIKMSCDISKWEWYGDSNTFRVFIHLLINAKYKEEMWQGMTLQRGQLMITLGAIAGSLNITPQSVRTSLKNLVMSGTITVVTNNKFHIITIVNYRRFQDQFAMDNHKKSDDLTNEKTPEFGLIRGVGGNDFLKSTNEDDLNFDVPVDKSKSPVDNFYKKQTKNYQINKREIAKSTNEKTLKCGSIRGVCGNDFLKSTNGKLQNQQTKTNPINKRKNVVGQKKGGTIGGISSPEVTEGKKEQNSLNLNPNKSLYLKYQGEKGFSDENLVAGATEEGADGQTEQSDRRTDGKEIQTTQTNRGTEAQDGKKGQRFVPLSDRWRPSEAACSAMAQGGVSASDIDYLVRAFVESYNSLGFFYPDVEREFLDFVRLYNSSSNDKSVVFPSVKRGRETFIPLQPDWYPSRDVMVLMCECGFSTAAIDIIRRRLIKSVNENCWYYKSYDQAFVRFSVTYAFSVGRESGMGDGEIDDYLNPLCRFVNQRWPNSWKKMREYVDNPKKVKEKKI